MLSWGVQAAHHHRVLKSGGRGAALLALEMEDGAPSQGVQASRGAGEGWSPRRKAALPTPSSQPSETRFRLLQNLMSMDLCEDTKSAETC